MREQLSTARSERERLREALGRAASGKEDASARVLRLEERSTAQQRRAELAAAVAPLPGGGGRLAGGPGGGSPQKNDRGGALSACYVEERNGKSAE